MSLLPSIARNFLGYGPVAPLRRLGGNDFVMAGGVDLVRSTIKQIIGTVRGEIRWKPGFGTTIDSKKHKLNTAALETQIQNDLVSAIQQWEPRIEVAVVVTKNTGNVLVARIRWSLIDRNVAGNQVILGPDEFEVRT